MVTMASLIVAMQQGHIAKFLEPIRLVQHGWPLLTGFSCKIHLPIIYTGSSHQRLAKESERFAAFKQQCTIEKRKEPQGDGVLIFDEVKVISRLMWNSRSQKIIGLAMSPADMSSLHDVYELVDEDNAKKQTSYILQFLW